MAVIRAGALLVALVAASAGCSAPAGEQVAAAGTAGQVTTTAAPTTTSAAPTTTTTVAPTTTLPPTTTTAAPVRQVTEQAWTPFAAVGGLVLRHPSARVERIGFHEANHDGARELEPLPTAVRPTTLESRERGTSLRTAADVVVDPAVEIRSPVTGTVKRAGTYVLYCKYSDDFLVIDPDDHPGWEVKLLHINGVRPRPGDRVVAGETVVASGPTQLPFESQVDETSEVQPAWPHVHVEVVDPNIPDKPNPGGGSC
jgi:hypothetical protein